MVLIITNSRDVTADFLCERLKSVGVSLERIDTDTVVETWKVEFSVSSAILFRKHRAILANEIQTIWFRRPNPIAVNSATGEPERLHIQGEWSEALEGFLAHVPFEKWVNHPVAIVASSHKMEQLSRAVAYGLQIPATLVSMDRNAVKQFWEKCDGKVIAKPLCSGFIEREESINDSSIYTNRLSKNNIADSSIENCPTLFQHEISKSFDVRVTVIDFHIHAVGIRPPDTDPQRIDIRRNNMSDVCYSELEIPVEIQSKLLRLLDSYRLRFAAIDFVVDQNENWIFLEINPNGQWAWLDLVGVSNIWRSFAAVFSSDNNDREIH